MLSHRKTKAGSLLLGNSQEALQKVLADRILAAQRRESIKKKTELWKKKFYAGEFPNRKPKGFVCPSS
jgi:hypothetical protein